jgi:cytochrome c biogenesis protein CcdA/thiol-disulfide isomerase/thioredoxin
MALLIPIALAAGVITVFTPCILPVLPIIFAGGTSSTTRRRPYAIVAGLVTTFTVFTLAGAWIFHELHIGSKYQIRIGAAALLVLALTLIVPKVAELLERPFLFLTRRRTGDLGGGFLLGASLGLVFVPCAGPVFGAVSTNVGGHRVGFDTVVIALAYAIGAAIPMLILAQGSRRSAALFRTHAQTVRIAAGVLMAAAAVVIYKGWATSLQTSVPGYAGTLQNWIEGNHAAKTRLTRLEGRSGHGFVAKPKPALASGLIKVPLGNYGSAPDFHGISHWLNTPGGRPLSLSRLQGHVVLVDFWTYSCINCLRTLPHLKAWYARYHPQGFEIVGVHTPEFAFEHDYGNVRLAVARLGVRYPVALDNDYATWNAYQNQYWPAEYLVDQTGNVRHVNFGEGDYGTTEKDIRLLLRAGGDSSLPSSAPMPDLTPGTNLTPETYLGYFRLDRYSGSTIAADVPHAYSFPRSLPSDHLAYAGTWTVSSERIVAGANARLRLHFHADDVYIVLGGHGNVRASVDGKPVGSFAVTADKLYAVLSGKHPRDGVLELAFTPGVNAYSFTFG